MTTYSQFYQRCKVRHDFDDQIQVRYQHGEGEAYDTWVSGTEALQRLQSMATQEQLQSLSQLTLEDLRVVFASMPEAARDVARRSLCDELADRLQSGIGDNVIGDSLVEALRGPKSSLSPEVSEKERWTALLRHEPFRKIVLDLAWIQLEGSFSDNDSAPLLDDWL